MASPSFLVVGHVTKDLYPRPNGATYDLGGGATYAALAARRLEQPQVALLTRADPEVAARLTLLLEGVAIHCLPAAATTTFRNEYAAGKRRQQLLDVAPPIDIADVPAAWRGAPVVLLAPVAGELPANLVDAFPQALLGLALQGWLRHRGADGLVEPAPWGEASAALARADVVVLSEEDVAGNEALVAQYAAQTRLLALTRGAGGASIYWRGRRNHSPAFAARELDPTGAGDVFAAALLIACSQGQEPLAAARFAHCAASFAVEAAGPAGVPRLEQVMARLANAGHTRPTNPNQPHNIPRQHAGDQGGGAEGDRGACRG
ncbi:MAG: PfkB family carbohydrate kinase [Chloroflexota bacterium]